MKSGENNSSMSFRARDSLTAIQGLGSLIAIRVSILSCGRLAKSDSSERADSATEDGNTGSELSREGGTERGG